MNESDERNEKPATFVKRVETRHEWSIQTLAIEILSIIVGVMLALGLNDWNDERKHRAQAQTALQNVSVEVRSNLKLLTFIHANNTAAIEAMSAGQESESDEVRNFIPGLQLRETAWATLLSTGLSNYVGYDTILRLSEMYSMQQIYKQTAMQLVEASMSVSAYATALETEVNNVHFSNQFFGYFELLSTIEAELLSLYDQAAELLEYQEK